ncbi:nuclear transcription factor Y subunit beta-like [Leptopilina heterotoma]|uniref:nuclear transcription factor Y subunit beta-like n=1 Tax=Leptopilina heterotoma TaxID=63436 RepID=UPI001CAA3AAE|nr:nuclear transcription factor Y subunit beta-like [Leptopilina heterotoma]
MPPMQQQQPPLQQHQQQMPPIQQQLPSPPLQQHQQQHFPTLMQQQKSQQPMLQQVTTMQQHQLPLLQHQPSKYFIDNPMTQNSYQEVPQQATLPWQMSQQQFNHPPPVLQNANFYNNLPLQQSQQPEKQPLKQPAFKRQYNGSKQPPTPKEASKEESYQDSDYFDTSDYPENNCYGIQLKNNKVLGLMKDECNGKIFTEFIGLRSKLYSYKILNENREKKKLKASGLQL